MKDEDGFKPIISARITQENPSVSFSFPIPDFLHPFVNALDNIDRALEYYLLARYAYLHNMNSSFMINSFWATEHLILSILLFKYSKKEDLLSIGGYHKITKYWITAKQMLSPEQSVSMNQFDSYIGTVMGYFLERYPDPEQRTKKVFKGIRNPKVVTGGDLTSKSLPFEKTYRLNLNELDHFINFMLHDITVFNQGDFVGNLMEKLASQDNIELYREENKYSIIHPNKLYSGEMANGSE